VLFKAAQRAVGGLRRPALLERSLSERPSSLLRFATRLAAAVTLIFGAAAFEHGAAAQPVAAEIAVDTTGGFARMVYHFNGDVDANARVANGILVISFNVPVTLSTDRLSSAAAGYVSAARRDPDGKGLRIALARKLTMHSMQANDRLFVDRLPDNWSGPPPSLPQDIVEDLARRAKEAERRARQIRLLAQQKQMVETRVRVAHQPNFSRYVFDLPELVAVIAERNGDKLNVQFDAPLKFDLAEAKASLPATIENIDAETGEQTTSIKFAFLSKVDIRSFREDNSYIIDVAPMDQPARRADAAPARTNNATSPGGEPPSGLEVPVTVPSNDRAVIAGKDPNKGGDRSEAATVARPSAMALDAAPPSMTFDPARELEAANLSALRPTIDAAGPSAAKDDPRTPPLPRSQNEMAGRPTAPAENAQPQRAQPPPQEVAEAETAANLAVADKAAPVKVRLERQNDSLKMVFPFEAPTSGAIFRRADTLWAVFDSAAPIDAAALQHDPTLTIGGVSVAGGPGFQFVRIKLERPRLASFSTADDNWTIAIGDIVLDPTLPLAVTRSVASRPSVAITFERPQAMRRVVDPDIGDTLFVVTGFAPARGLLKEQDFLEFHILASTHGIVIQPLADDVDAELADNKLLISRPPGLILSAASEVGPRGHRPVVLDPHSWGFDREAAFGERQKALITAAADAPAGRRMPARFDLARFYLAREMYAEAKGVLDVALAEDHPTAEDPTGLVMRAIAKIMMGRIDEGLQDLASPLVGNNHDAQLWRALAFAKQGKWGEANENFKKMESAITTLPMEFQRQVILEAVRASIETRDFAAAASKLNEFDTLG
jgi:hypothetical protein